MRSSSSASGSSTAKRRISPRISSLPNASPDELYPAGSGSFAVEVAEWARDGGWSVAGLIELIDDSRIGTIVAGLKVIAADAPPAGGRAVLAIGGPRAEHWPLLEGHGWRAASVVHPTAHVSPTATLADGCVVAPGAVIGAQTRIGAHTLVSRGTLVGHHGRIGSFVSLLPGANVGGHAEIGDRAVLGMGAIVVNDVRVGCESTVAAGAVVLRDVGAGARVQGVPAREYSR